MISVSLKLICTRFWDTIRELTIKAGSSERATNDFNYRSISQPHSFLEISKEVFILTSTKMKMRRIYQ